MDYYLRTTSKEDFLKDLILVEIEIDCFEHYFQNQSIIIDWIGQIPIIDENAELIDEIIYNEGQYVNIRSIEAIDVSKFINTEDVHPNKPYRIFS